MNMKKIQLFYIEAEVGVVMPQAKEYLRLEEVRDPSLEALKGKPFVTPPLGLLAPRTLHSFLSVWQSPIVGLLESQEN